MSLRVFTAVLVASFLAALGPATAEILPTPPGWQIERAVLLNRHGVRSPTATNEQLDRYSATAWPTWPVEPGFLSPRGEELMRLMGTYYRVLYGGRGLVQADDCPAVGTVAAWTDLDAAHARIGRGDPGRHVSALRQPAAAQPGELHAAGSAVPSAADGFLPHGRRVQPCRYHGATGRQLRLGSS